MLPTNGCALRGERRLVCRHKLLGARCAGKCHTLKAWTTEIAARLAVTVAIFLDVRQPDRHHRLSYELPANGCPFSWGNSLSAWRSVPTRPMDAPLWPPT